jgi:hypothetical protein
MSELTWGLILGFAAGFLAGLIVARFLTSQPAPPGQRASTAPHTEPLQTPLLEQMLGKADTAEELRQNLRLKFLYDEAKIDQAIAFERERDPKASEVELMQAAIYRWERTNH